MIEIIYLLAIALIAFSLGRSFLKKAKFNSPYEEIVFSMGLGLGIISLIIFFMTALHLLDAKYIYFLSIIGFIFSFKDTKYIFSLTKKIYFKKLTNLQKFLSFFICLFVVLHLIGSLAPPFLYDEMSYQLAFPKIWQLNNGFVDSYDNWRHHFPFNVNMLFLLGIILKNGILGKMFIYLFGILLSAGIYSFSIRFFSKDIALIASLIYLTLPMISGHIGSAYIDIAVTFYIFLGIYAILITHFQKDQRWIFLSALIFGFSIASKHVALLFLPIQIALLTFVLWKRNSFLGILKKVIFYLAICFIIASPWYIKSYIYTGNPIWPFYNDIFEGRNWDNSFEKESFEIGWFYKHGQSLIGFLSVFWELTMHSSKYMMLLGFGPIFLAFAPLSLFWLRKNKLVSILLIVSAAAMIIWYFKIREIRMLAYFPIFCILSAFVINEIFKRKLGNTPRNIVAALLISTLLFNTAIWYGVNAKKIPFVFGLEDEKLFYSKLNEPYGFSVFEFINNNLQNNSKILIYRDTRGYLSDRNYLIAPEYSQVLIDFRNIENENELYKRLKELQISHALINNEHGLFKPGRKIDNFQPYVSERSNSIMHSMLGSRGELMLDSEGFKLYRIK